MSAELVEFCSGALIAIGFCLGCIFWFLVFRSFT